MLISLFAKYIFDESNCAERSDAKILHLISVTLPSFILLSVVMPQIIGLNTNSSFCFVSWCSLLLY